MIQPRKAWRYSGDRHVFINPERASSDDVPVRGAPEHIHTFREPHVGLEEDEVVVVLLAARRAQVNKLLM